VVSCFGDSGQERGQSIFYFSGETNSAMEYVIISFVLLWYYFRICFLVLCSILCEGVPSPQGRDIDGKYLDVNEAELKAMF
jgi:hypothetical protein